MKLIESGRPVARYGAFVPGPGGYVIALVIGWFVCSVLLLVPNWFETDPINALAAMLVYVQFLMVACATYGLPVSVATVLVLHFCCRGIRSELVHVLVAGLVGGLFGAAWVHFTLPDLFLYDGDNSLGQLWPTISIGIGAAVGRLLGARWLPVR